MVEGPPGASICCAQWWLLARRIKPKKKPVSYPDWKLCGRHGIWFCFQCERCSGTLMRYNGT
jgi:hypothetical protein